MCHADAGPLTKATEKTTKSPWAIQGCAKQQSPMRKPGIPPARIPEITEGSLHGITVTLTL